MNAKHFEMHIYKQSTMEAARHNSEVEYQCNQCENLFPSNDHLEQHMKTHTIPNININAACVISHF